MSIFAVGDIQGCYKEFRNLLKEINFNKNKDVLWLAGDLVNRGPNSFDVIKYIMDLDSKAVTVLGNHDFYLLASYFKADPWPHKNNNFQEIINDSHGKEIIYWLKKQKVVHMDHELGFILVHAGIHPNWGINDIEFLSRKIENNLQGENCKKFIETLWDNNPKKWKKNLSDKEKLIFATNVFTRMRYLNNDLSLDFNEKSNPNEIKNRNIYPWFNFENKNTEKYKTIIGHWSSLGYFENKNLISIDTGCAWGRELTAIKLLQDKKIKKYQIKC